MGRLRTLHPLAFAAFPVLSLYSVNVGLVPITDIGRPLAILVCGVIVVWALLALVLRNIERAAAVASVGVLGLFTFGFLFSWASRLTIIETYLPKPLDFLYLWVPAMLVPLILVGWKRESTAGLTKFLNVVGLALVVMPTVSIVMSKLQIRSAMAKLPASQVTSAGGAGGHPPDIYYIILDGYGRADELKHYFGIDNAPFLKTLAGKGFYVADKSHSNYCQTELSLASSLNLNFTDKLLKPVEDKEQYRYQLDRLVDESFVSRSLRKNGYEYIAVTSGFPGFTPRSAGLWLKEDTGFSLFESALLANTPLRSSSAAGQSQYVARRHALDAAFQHLEQLGPGGDRPRFVFAHILAPHPPFVFGANGEPIRAAAGPYGLWDGSHYFAVGLTRESYLSGYKNQLLYINKRVLHCIDAILKNSKVPPVVIVQGDHGSRAYLDHDSLDKTDVRESFRNLNTYLVPATIKASLYPGITPVNSFRIVLSKLFGESFTLLPDRSFYTTWESPEKPIEVTDKIEKSF